MTRIMNSCCGFSLAAGAKTIAIFQLIVSVCLFLLGTLVITAASNSYHVRNEIGVRIAMLIVTLIYCFVSVCLLTGVSKRSVGRLDVWIVFNCVCFALGIYQVISTALSQRKYYGRLDLVSYFLGITQLILLAWFLCVVTEFRAEVTAQQRLKVKKEAAIQQAASIATIVVIE